MALARIITRSHACSQELALDLLARGYAVEIVSPDAIPDNLADLELRVDAAPGDRLIASVEAHNGGHSAALDFLHHLKAPMVDFIRRPPERGDALHFPGQPVAFNAEPSIEDIELPAEAPQPAPKTVFPAAEVLRDPVLDPEEGARPTAPQDTLPSPPPAAEPPGYFAVEDWKAPRPTMVRPEVRPAQAPQRRYRPARWRWRAALTFASVVVLALVLGFGMRRTGKASAQISGEAPAGKVAASADADLLSAPTPEKDLEKGPDKDPGQISAVAEAPPAMKSAGAFDHAPKETPVAKTGAPAAGTSAARASTAKAVARTSRWHGDGLIAHDTVTYLDERYKPAPTAQPAKSLAVLHPNSRQHRGGVIAASKVTYLNNPAAKAAERKSGVKRHSNRRPVP